jgi:hypothetical protein
MKKIQEFSLWYNGELRVAKWVNVYVSTIMLGVSAEISFQLYEGRVVDDVEIEGGVLLSSGTLKMQGQDYANWGDDDDYVWDWAANKLGLVIVPPQENN